MQLKMGIPDNLMKLMMMKKIKNHLHPRMTRRTGPSNYIDSTKHLDIPHLGTWCACLNSEERRLMTNAKGGEVSSFLKTQAVRRCLTYEEQQEAQQSDHVLRARWVLVWKPVPEEYRNQARADRLANPDTTVYDESLTRKAKARIVLLGFQPPDLKGGYWSQWLQFQVS